MTSKLVVNTIEADTGISSVSFASSISLSSTSKFHFSAAGIDIDADTNVNRPAAGVLGFNINSSEKMRLDSSGRLLIGTTTEGNESADELTINSSGNTGVTVRSGSSSNGSLFFSDTTSGAAEYVGFVQYQHASNIMIFGTSSTERLRITSDGSIGINATTPSAGDLATGDSQNTPLLHVYGSGASATTGEYNLLARFEAGTDADSTGAMIVINHANDRGLAIQGGRRTGNYAHGALKMIDNVGRLSNAIFIHGGAGHGVNHMGFYTGESTTTTERLRITSSGTLLLGTSTETNNIRLGNKFGIAGTTAYTGMSISNYAGTAAAAGPMIDLNRSRGTSDGSMTTVAVNDKLGEFIFRGSNGSAFADAVTLRGYAGTVSGSNVNGKYEISTSNAGSMTVRLRVDENGYVTKPAHPAFFVTMNGGDQTTAAANIMPFDTVVHNNGGHFKTSGADIYNFVCPVDGYYFFGGQVWLKHGSGTGNHARWEIWRDTQILALAGWHQNGVNLNDMQSSASVTVYCTAGAKVYMEADYALTYWRGNSSQPHTFFHGHLIG